MIRTVEGTIMDATPLYDLSPIFRLMLLGCIVAAGPLAWIWLRNRQASVVRRLQALTIVTLFLTFDLVLFGAFTRLTDSGLGCPDWPGCYGAASPMGARHDIHAAQTAMPTGPVTFSKAWVEMIHRYLATGLGVLIVVLTVVSWMERRRLRISPWWPTFTLFWVCLQGALGALTVTLKLFPAIVTLHLLGGMVLLALLRAQALRYAQADPVAPQVPVVLPARIRWAIGLVFALLSCQIVLGGWVSTNYAVLACTDFPTCQGSWWPVMNFHEGFYLWRELGEDRSGASIPFDALTAIHYVHRLTAYAVFVALGWLAWHLWRLPALRNTARWIVALALWQLLTGVSNVLFDWPLLAAVSHTGGAAGLVLVLTGALLVTRSAMPARQGIAHPPVSPLSP